MGYMLESIWGTLYSLYELFLTLVALVKLGLSSLFYGYGRRNWDLARLWIRLYHLGNHRNWKSNSGFTNNKASNLSTSNSWKDIQDFYFKWLPTLFSLFCRWGNWGSRKTFSLEVVSRTELCSPRFSFFPPEPSYIQRLRPAYPQPAPENGDLAPCLLFALPPFHQVEAIVDGQRDVPLAHGGVDSASQQVGLGLQRHLHAVGQQQPQRAVGPDVVAVPHLVWGGRTQTPQKGWKWRGYVYGRGSGVVFKCVYFFWPSKQNIIGEEN